MKDDNNLWRVSSCPSFAFYREVFPPFKIDCTIISYMAEYSNRAVDVSTREKDGNKPFRENLQSGVNIDLGEREALL